MINTYKFPMFFLKKVAILMMIATSYFIATNANAEEDEAGATEEVIIIGTAGGAGIDKADVSFAVSQIDAEDIQQISPKSTADLLKTIPGVWAESSGGVAGANIDVRGLPGGSDAPFVTLSLTGSPLYGTESLSFFEQSTIFRIDETINTIEGLRGGPGSVFGKGEPGLTVNFNLKEGGEETEGRAKYTTSDYGLQRIDGYVSGKLAEDLFYMVGGYTQASDGIRDAQFTSEEGYQVTVNLTKHFDNGKVNVFTRITDDHGQWYLPIALNAGHDLGDFSQLGNNTRLRTITVNPAGDTEVFDFSDGRGWDGSVSGANIEFDLGNGWTIRDKFIYTDGDADTFGFVPAGGAVTAAALAGVIGGPVTTAGGSILGAGDFVQTYGHWVVLKELRHFANDLSINKEIADHDITVGLYQSSFSADDWWSIGNPVAVHNTANGDLLAAAITPADIATAGGNAGFAFGLASAGDAQVTAVYIADSWQITEQFRLDAGVRKEYIDIDYVLDTGPGYPDGVRDLSVDLDADEIAWTVGGNWQFNDDVGAFARFSRGFVMPNFDIIRNNGGSANVQEIDQYELGLKYSVGYFDIFVTGFFNTNDAFSSVVGSVIAASEFETESKGIEIDGLASFDVGAGQFNVGVTGILQDAEITKSTTVANEGNSVLRQPDWQFRISPSYQFNVMNSDVTLYAAFSLVGDRFGDNANTIDLEGYEKIDAGLHIETPSGVFVQVHADNLNESEGLTEGDPRNPSAPNGRPLLGRSVNFSIGYDF